MASKESALEWLHQRTKDHRDGKTELSEVVEDFDDVGKLEQHFASVDDLVEIIVGQGSDNKPTYMSANLQGDQRETMCQVLREFAYCFAWNYTEMPGLS
jgi:hypothetical protein